MASAREKLKGTVSEAIFRDIDAGQEFGKELLPAGSLGRVDETRSGDISDVIARRRALLGGLTGEESQAARDIATQNIGRETQGRSRQLAALQGRAGIRGGLAGAQQAGVLESGAEQRANFERQLLLENRGAQERALGAFEQSVGSAEANELGRQQFNLSQSARERQAQLSTALGIAQLGTAERSALRSKEAIAATGAAPRLDAGGNLLGDAVGGAFGAATNLASAIPVLGGPIASVTKSIGSAVGSVFSGFCYSSGTLIEMEDGTYKDVSNIKVGDNVAEGGRVHGIGEVETDYTFLYKGEIVTGRHAVLENNIWIRVEDSKQAVFLGQKVRVYPVCNEFHRMVTDKGLISLDFEETNNKDLSHEEIIRELNREWKQKSIA
jgi:hypothetical protein